MPDLAAPLTTVTFESQSDVQPGRHADAARRLGQVLAGRYHLVRVLGSGGGGDVYEAREVGCEGAPVALKILRHAGSAESLYRLKREFRACEQLQHEHLVALHELHCNEHEAFFTMDLVRGVDFRSYARPAGELDAARLAQAMRGLVRGVCALHAAGRLHRDLKPGNVLVTDEGRVVIVDFGLTLELEVTRASTLDRGFAGTVEYAAPEQLALQPMTEQTDWYAVGAMLFEALTGSLPFEGSTAEIVAAKLESKPMHAGSFDTEHTGLLELARRLVSHAPAMRPSVSEIWAALGDAPEPVRTERTVDLVGRARELGELTREFAEVERGDARVVLVVGESGIGKTSFVQAFAASLSRTQRACVLRGRCYVHEEIPYRALDGIVDALSHYLRGLGPLEAATLVPRDIRALSQVFPVLLRIPSVRSFPPSRNEPAHEPRALRERAARALRELLLAIADRVPLVLCIDDIQWSDPDSAWLLSAVLSGPEPPSLLLVTTCRSDSHAKRFEAAANPIQQALSEEPAIRARTRIVALSGMAPDELDVLVRRELGAGTGLEHLARDVVRESGGHPLFAIELARQRSTDRGASLSLDQAILAQVEALSSGARDGLLTVCAAGHPLPRAFLQTELGTSADCVRELERKKLVLSEGNGPEARVTPYHDRVREALLAHTPPPRTRAVHVRLAEAFTRAGAASADRAVEHFLAAGERRRASKLAERAVQHAERTLAFHRMPELLELLVAESAGERRAEAQRALAEAYARVGRVRDAAVAFSGAAALQADDELRFELECRAMWHALRGGHTELGFALLHRLGRELGSLVLLRPWLGWLVMTPLYFWWRLTSLPPLMPPPLTDSPALRKQRRLLLFSWVLFTGMSGRDTARTGFASVLCLRLSARLGDAGIYATLSAMVVAGKGSFSGRLPRGYHAEMARAADHAHRVPASGAPLALSMVRMCGAMGIGQFAEAERHAEEVVEASTDGQDLADFARTFARLSAVPLMFWQGSLRRAEPRIEAWLRAARSVQHLHMVHALGALGAYRHLLDDRPEQAIAEWNGARDRDPDNAALWDPIWGVIIGLYAGRLDQARTALTHGARMFFRWTLFITASRVLFVWVSGALASVALAREPRRLGPRLISWLCRTLLACESTPYCVPFALHLRAQAAYRRGDVARAARQLELCLAAYEERGMELFAACVAEVLARLHPELARRPSYAARARGVFERERLARPERWVRALVPGFDAPP